MKKWSIFIIYLIAITIIFFNREFLIKWIEYSDPSYLPLMFLLSTFFATVPVVPFALFAGIMGLKYGVLIGLLINWLGGLTASVIYFLLARYIFADFFKKYIKQYRGINKFNSMIEKNAFFAIFFARMVPYATSMGHVLLANLPKDELEIYLEKMTFEKFTSHTITDKEQLLNVLHKVRESGWGGVDQQLEEGLRSIAVPIKNGEGKVFAAINCSAHAGRISKEILREEFLLLLFESAKKISKTIVIKLHLSFIPFSAFPMATPLPAINSIHRFRFSGTITRMGKEEENRHFHSATMLGAIKSKDCCFVRKFV